MAENQLSPKRRLWLKQIIISSACAFEEPHETILKVLPLFSPNLCYSYNMVMKLGQCSKVRVHNNICT